MPRLLRLHCKATRVLLNSALVATTVSRLLCIAVWAEESQILRPIVSIDSILVVQDQPDRLSIPWGSGDMERAARFVTTLRNTAVGTPSHIVPANRVLILATLLVFQDLILRTSRHRMSHTFESFILFRIAKECVANDGLQLLRGNA